MYRILATAIFSFYVSAQAFAWGPKGHHIVADIAKDHLNPNARRAVVQLLGTDDLASIASWADEIKRERPETAGWHFVDIPWNADGFNEPRDCYRPGRDAISASDHHNCIVDRIELFARVLADKRAPRNDRVEALKFLVHFVGDLHQPLHAMAEARGGNDIHVVQFGSTTCGSRLCDLHGTWDIGLLKHSRWSEGKYVQRLEHSSGVNRARAEGRPEQWANESFHIAHDVWLKDGGTVDENYYRRNIHVLDQQLLRAGLRLADLLNRALGK